MSLYRHTKLSQHIQLGIWEITESVEELFHGIVIHEEEKASYDSFTNNSRKKQWLATRRLLAILGKRDDLWIDHDENRKPIISDNDICISITHTQDYAAILLGKNVSLGIDIEKIHPRILKIKHKFVADEEFLFLSEDENYLAQLYLIWSAKEAMFKYYEKGNMDFKKHMFVYPFEFKKSGIINAHINCNHMNQEINLCYEQIDDHILVYTKHDNRSSI
jgi:phosphopantetheinyl transferase